MKICDNHNGQISLLAKQKYEVLSATLAKDLFFKLMLVDLSKSELELLMCAALIVPKSGDNVLAESLAMLESWGADTILRKRISGL